MKNETETIEYIHSLGFFSKEASLERITALLNKLNNPQNNFPSIHIAGTNGKGSTAAFTASVLRSSGLKTALFVSPYIIEFRERISINGEFISADDLVRLSNIVKETGIEVTEFEFITAVAFLYFAEKKCDVAVVETGLGGRLDATNTLQNVLVSVITKIGLDHTAILGDTIEKITEEKCGIIKNALTVTYPLQDDTALDVIKKSADNLVMPNLSKLKIKNIEKIQNEFIYDGVCYKTRLSGKYQVYNAVTAIETVKNCGIEIDEKYIQEGLWQAQFPARLECFGKDNNIILDGAHNPDGAYALREVLKEYGGNVTAVIGMMKDKNVDEVLLSLLPLCKSVITVTVPNNPRAMDAEELSQKAEKYCGDVMVAENLDLALKQAKNKGNTIFIFGSFYLASAVRPLLLAK